MNNPANDASNRYLSLAREQVRADPRRALGPLRAAAAHAPNDVELQTLLGHCARLAGDVQLAEAVLRRALVLDPRHGEAAASLAHLLRNQGRYAAAAQTMADHAARARPGGDDLQAHIDFVRECGRSDLAMTLCESRAADCDDHAGCCFARAELHLSAGQFDSARTHLLRTLTLDPGHAGAWLRLAHARRFSAADDADLALLERVAAEPRDAHARIAIAFALGKVHDDLGDPARAATHFARGNAEQRALLPWDGMAWSAELAARVAAPRPLAAVPQGSVSPVFVIGMPRSGTSVIAERLARHPKVRHRGELNWLAELARHWRANPTRDTATLLGAHYLAHVVRDDAVMPFYLDKNPLNFRDLDAVAALLPHARLLHVRRDPRDTALSIYQQWFAHPDSAFAYDWDDIARYTRDYQQAMADWPARLGLECLPIDYEDFVAGPEEQLNRVWRWLGLDPSAASSTFMAPAEAARTASVWQLRQQVHQRSRGRWQAYAPHCPALTTLDWGI